MTTHPSRPQATTLEELRTILTEEVWVPGCPKYASHTECLATAIDPDHIMKICGQLAAVGIFPEVDPSDGFVLSDKQRSGLVAWNDAQTDVNAIHDLIDRAIVIRDGEPNRSLLSI